MKRTATLCVYGKLQFKYTHQDFNENILSQQSCYLGGGLFRLPVCPALVCPPLGLFIVPTNPSIAWGRQAKMVPNSLISSSLTTAQQGVNGAGVFSCQAKFPDYLPLRPLSQDSFFPAVRADNQAD